MYEHIMYLWIPVIIIWNHVKYRPTPKQPQPPFVTFFILKIQFVLKRSRPYGALEENAGWPAGHNNAEPP